jgi:two-component system, OmpR family, phosphate regulon response regulator PhoB
MEIFMAANILLVEDEIAIRDMLEFALETEGFAVFKSSSSEQAMNFLHDNQVAPDLILLDWMLPGASGVEFCRKLKKDDRFKKIPVIMLTARGEEDDRVRGLEVGADDYIVKPFSPRELIARVRAVIRRAHPELDEKVVEFGGLRIETANHKVAMKGQPINLGPTEYKLLLHFMENPERVYNREQLLDAVWGKQIIVEERTVDVHIRRLRKALEVLNADKYVQTVRGAGYRFSHRG